MYLDKKSFSELITWLESDGHSLFVPPAKGYSTGTSFVRIPVGDAVDAVFGANFYPSSGEKPFASSEKLDLVGFFQKSTGVFYSSVYLYEVPDCENIASVQKELECAVKDEATKQIRRNAEALKASATQEMRDHIVENDCLINRIAYARFFGDEYRGSIDFPKPTISRADTVDYLNSPGDVLDRMVEKYLSGEKKDMIVQNLLLEDAVAEAYAVFSANPPQWAMVYRDIMRALEESEAVNVRITIENQQGQTMTFSYPVTSMVNIPTNRGDSAYTGWVLTGKQRAEVEDFFRGDESRPYCGSGFRPEEIKQITYKKKVLFQR